MTLQISPGSSAGPRDRQAARARLELLANELPRVRAAATGWRNGIAALMAGVIGFGLIKGRSDVGELAGPYDWIVGLLLLGALISGSVAAVLLMRAVHGRPAASAMRDVVDGVSGDPGLHSRLAEGEASARALTRGVVLSFASAAVLCAAVGITWYGPAKDDPRSQFRLTDGTTVCGTIVSTASGTATVETSAGQVAVDLLRLTGLQAVASCPNP